ncbi:hypothetical protein ACFX13_035581 [Malus domestica]
MWFILRVYTFLRSLTADETGLFFWVTEGLMFVVFATSMTFLTVSALSLYGRYVMAIMCAVSDHHKSVRLAVVVETGVVDMDVGAAGIDDRGLVEKFPI